MKKFVTVFLGEGSQELGIAKSLHDSYRRVQEIFNDISSALGKNFVQLCFVSSNKILSETDNATLATYLLGVSVNAILEEAGLVPAATAGFGGGFFAAAVESGAISVMDGAYLLSRGSAKMKELHERFHGYTIFVSGISEGPARRLCEHYGGNTLANHISVSGSLDEEFILLSGCGASLPEILQPLSGVNAEVHKRKILAELYTDYASEVGEEIREVMPKVTVEEPKEVILVYPNDGTELHDPARIREKLSDHYREHLSFRKAMNNLAALDPEVVMIVSSSEVLYNAVKASFAGREVFQVYDVESLSKAISAVGGSMPKETH